MQPWIAYLWRPVKTLNPIVWFHFSEAVRLSGRSPRRPIWTRLGDGAQGYVTSCSWVYIYLWEDTFWSYLLDCVLIHSFYDTPKYLCVSIYIHIYTHVRIHTSLPLLAITLLLLLLLLLLLVRLGVVVPLPLPLLLLLWLLLLLLPLRLLHNCTDILSMIAICYRYLSYNLLSLYDYECYH